MKMLGQSQTHFAVCLTNAEPDLQARKVYKVLPDEQAAKDHYVRVVDEPGEDYLYPETFFIVIQLLHEAEQALLQVS